MDEILSCNIVNQKATFNPFSVVNPFTLKQNIFHYALLLPRNNLESSSCHSGLLSCCSSCLSVSFIAYHPFLEQAHLPVTLFFLWFPRLVALFILPERIYGVVCKVMTAVRGFRRGILYRFLPLLAVVGITHYHPCAVSAVLFHPTTLSTPHAVGRLGNHPQALHWRRQDIYFPSVS